MKYFRWTPDFINTMTWPNYMLFMSSIPSYKEDKPEEKLIEKDAADAF